MNQNRSWNGEYVVITGGTGALGGACGELFARRGYGVILCGRDAQKAQQKADQLDAAPDVPCIGAGADINRPEELLALREKVLALKGEYTVLIHAAGGNRPGAVTEKEQWDGTGSTAGSFFDLSLDEWKAVNDLNYTGAVSVIQILGEPLAQNRKGVILTLTSMAAQRPLTRVGGYGAAKAALSQFTQWLAVHLAPSGVRVNAIAPGFFLTEQNRMLLTDGREGLTPRGEKIINATPMGRFGNPHEVASLALFLAGESAGFITGAVIPVDGGFGANSGV